MSLATPPTRRGVRPTRLLALLLAFAGVLFVGVTATDTASAAPKSAAVTATVHGKAANGKAVTGTYKITKFSHKNGKLVAKGTFTGKVGHSAKVKKAVTVPVNKHAAAAAKSANAAVQPMQATTCPILDLVLGPLDLNLLGLVVHLDQVHLNITAQQGAGNLLGNLLCAVAGLLDNTGTSSLNAILSQLLTSLLGLLGGLGG